MNVKDCKYSFTLKEKVFIKYNHKIVPVKVLGIDGGEPEYYIENNTVYVCLQFRDKAGIPIGVAVYLPIKESVEEFKRMINNE